MKIIVIGCGNIGSVAADDLSRSLSNVEITLADNNKEKVKSTAGKIKRKNVKWRCIDATDKKQLINEIKKYNLVVGLLPADFGYSLIESCINAGRDLVDVSYMPENPLKLNNSAVKAGVTVIPDCGLAPGISNVLVGHAVSKLDKVLSVHILVGGLPEKPVPPLGYTVTWSPENLIDEYTRKTRIQKKGKMVEVETLSGLEEIEIPKAGRLEAFFTDGLRTLLHTVQPKEEMWEKTLRYPGHVEKIKLLKSLGFFEQDKIKVAGNLVSPKKFTATLFEKTLRKSKIKDIVALRVKVSGIKNNVKRTYLYHLFDRFDSKSKTSAMSRTTAYPASVFAQILLKKIINKKGVIALEKLGSDKNIYNLFISELNKRGIRVIENNSP
ncbi:MAG: saccharopine dehydrogenase family protein [Planctomycetota bacterium]